MQASRWAPGNSEDAFAQTREPDNLFDDDITPIAEPIVQSIPSSEQPARQRTPNQRARGNTRGRGRGRGHHSDSPRRQDSSTPQSETKDTSSQPATTTSSSSKETGTETPEPAPESSGQDVSSDAGADASAPAVVAAKVQAVRGPRHQTGGVQRPKLTEDELSARMAAAALNNAKREAAHKEAEADAAKFEAREAAAKQRRVQENTARRVMDNEREKNRQRKLGAQGVREWDQGKDEGQLSSGQARRGNRGGLNDGGLGGVPRRPYTGPGAHGGIVSVEVGTEEPDDFGQHPVDGDDNSRGGSRGRGRGRGRGQRGSRGGRGRGAFDGTPAKNNRTSDTVPSLGEDQFPALNTSPKPTDSSKAKDSMAAMMSPIADKGTWADQVEASQ